MPTDPTVRHNRTLRTVTREVATATDPTVRRIVALVDSLTIRGAADQVLAPLRRRLLALRPPRPLRFARLLFCPLDPLIVPAARWRPDQATIPRTAMATMASHVHLMMGQPARAIEAQIGGQTDDARELIASLGQSLWPTAAVILAAAAIPANWHTTGLPDAVYRPLATIVSALLRQTAALDRLCAETANGLLPPNPEAIGTILTEVSASKPPALTMMMTLLLSRLPEAAAWLPERPDATVMVAAMEQAADTLLRQLLNNKGVELRIVAGTTADASMAVKGTLALLRHLNGANATPERREDVRLLLRRLDASCSARFTSALHGELLDPLQNSSVHTCPEAIPRLESIARNLRVLATEARTIGSGATYDLLLNNAAETIKDRAMRDRLSLVDQARLVEILAGPEAALALLPHRPG